MKRRQWLILAGLVVLAGAVVLSRMLASQAEPPGKRQAAQLRRPVDTLHMKARRVQSYVRITGRLQPEDQIDLVAEVSGVLQPTPRPFKVGTRYRRGDILLDLDAQEAQQELIAQRAALINTLSQVVPDLKIDFPKAYPKWRDYLMEFDPENSVPPLPEIDDKRVKLFLTSRNVFTQYHQIRRQEVRISKYTLRAPFDGVLTEASVNTGTLVQAGRTVGEFVKTGVYELEAAIPPQELTYVSVGDDVALTDQNGAKSFEGRIVRINEKLDPATQSVKLFVRVRDQALRAGMYLRGRIEAQAFDTAFVLNRDYVIDDQAVFVLHQDSIARIQEIEPLKISEEEIILRGLKDGSIVIAEEKTRAFDGQLVDPVKSKML